MKFTKIADPKQDFWNSVQAVTTDIQHIERLKRQMDIHVRNMETTNQIDHRTVNGAIMRAVELRLIDLDDTHDFDTTSPEGVKAAFNFVKTNIGQIQEIAGDPYKHEDHLDKTSMRDAAVKRRHFSDLTS
ncbi:MAG TPA: hypothetical protein VGD95_08840 [Micavibrio sp.]